MRSPGPALLLDQPRIRPLHTLSSAQYGNAARGLQSDGGKGAKGTFTHARLRSGYREHAR